MKTYKEYYEEERMKHPYMSEETIRNFADLNYVHDSRAESTQRSRMRKFCVEIPKDTKTVNINININEAPHQDCVCQQILVRMLNGKEYWL